MASLSSHAPSMGGDLALAQNLQLFSNLLVMADWLIPRFARHPSKDQNPPLSSTSVRKIQHRQWSRKPHLRTWLPLRCGGRSNSPSHVTLITYRGMRITCRADPSYCSSKQARRLLSPKYGTGSMLRWVLMAPLSFSIAATKERGSSQLLLSPFSLPPNLYKTTHKCLISILKLSSGPHTFQLPIFEIGPLTSWCFHTYPHSFFQDYLTLEISLVCLWGFFSAWDHSTPTEWIRNLLGWEGCNTPSKARKSHHPWMMILRHKHSIHADTLKIEVDQGTFGNASRTKLNSAVCKG